MSLIYNGPLSESCQQWLQEKVNEGRTIVDPADMDSIGQLYDWAKANMPLTRGVGHDCMEQPYVKEYHAYGTCWKRGTPEDMFIVFGDRASAEKFVARFGGKVNPFQTVIS